MWTAMLGCLQRASPQGKPRGRRAGVQLGESSRGLDGRRITGGRADILLPEVEETLGQRAEIDRIRHAPEYRNQPTALASPRSAVHHPTMTSPEKPVDPPGDQAAVVKIKKYANRRLYNTATSSYVTLDDLSQMVKERVDFIVHDAKTGDDITRSVLTQIIVEEENKGQNLLPIGFLRQLIGFYGDNLQSLVPRYLDASMQMFTHNQDEFRNSMKSAFGGFFPFGPQIEDLNKQNMAMFQNTMAQIWAPFAQQRAAAAAAAGAKPADEATGLDDLKRQMEAIQRRLDELSKK